MSRLSSPISLLLLLLLVVPTVVNAAPFVRPQHDIAALHSRQGGESGSAPDKGCTFENINGTEVITHCPRGELPGIVRRHEDEKHKNSKSSSTDDSAVTAPSIGQLEFGNARRNDPFDTNGSSVTAPSIGGLEFGNAKRDDPSDSDELLGTTPGQAELDAEKARLGLTRRGVGVGFGEPSQFLISFKQSAYLRLSGDPDICSASVGFLNSTPLTEAEYSWTLLKINDALGAVQT